MQNKYNPHIPEKYNTLTIIGINKYLKDLG